MLQWAIQQLGGHNLDIFNTLNNYLKVYIFTLNKDKMFGPYLTKFASVILVRAGYVHLRASKALAKVLHRYTKVVVLKRSNLQWFLEILWII